MKVDLSSENVEVLVINEAARKEVQLVITDTDGDQWHRLLSLETAKELRDLLTRALDRATAPKAPMSEKELNFLMCDIEHQRIGDTYVQEE